MTARGGRLRRAVLVGLLGLLGLLGLGLGANGLCSRSAGAEEDDPTPRKVRVLGPDGHALEHLLLVPLTQMGAKGPVFDEVGVTGDLVACPGGILKLPSRPGPSGWVVTADRLAAAYLPRVGSLGGIRLLRSASLQGALRFHGARPAAGLVVLAVPHGRAGLTHRVRTDEAGRYHFAHLGAGDWALAVLRGDGRVQTMGVFTAGQPTDAQILRPGSLVEGEIRDADANTRVGVADVGFRLVRLPRTPSPVPAGAGVHTTKEGTFRLADVPGGVYVAELVGESAHAYTFDPELPRLEVPAAGRMRLRAWYVRRNRVVVGRVEGEGGAPVAGAEVRVLRDATAETSPSSVRPVPPARTGADGSYRLVGVPIGAGYRLLVRHERHAPYVGEPFDVTRPEERELDPVYLLRGWRLDVRARAPGGALLAGVEVSVTPAGRPSDAWPTEDGEAAYRKARTDASGEAHFPELPLEDVRVEAGGGGLLTVRGVVTMPRTGDSQFWTATLFDAPSLRGEVLFDAEDGPEPVTVHVVPRDGSPPRTAAPDPAGRFVVRELPAVPVDVEVRRRDGVVLGRVEGVVPGAAGPVRILLPPLVTIEGRVVDLAAGGGGVEVILEAPVFSPLDDEHRWQVVAAMRLDATDGRADFSFARMMPGLYTLRARQGDNDTGATTVLAVDSTDEILLAMPEAGRVAGTVLDEEDRELLGAEVRLVRLRGEGESPGLPGGPLRAVTDLKGAYVFPGVAPGPWRVEVRDGQRAGDTDVIRVAEGESLVLRDLSVRAGGVLQGRVTDGAGRAQDGARLRLEAVTEGGEIREISSGRDGRYRARGLAPGLWRVRVLSSVGAFRDLEILAEIREYETTEADLVAEGSARIDGTVRRQGRPVVDAAVYLVRRAEGAGEIARRRIARTDGEGAFTFRRLEPGIYEVDLVDGGVRVMRPTPVYEGDVVALELEAYDGRLPGEVIMPSGHPVAGATVVAKSVAPGWGGLEAQVHTDPEGRFLFLGLPIGAYDLEVFTPGLPPGEYRGAFAEVEGAERPVTITIGRGGTLDLSVKDENGRGVSATRIWLETEDGTPLHRRPYVTVPSGRLLVEGVPAGVWWLRVHAERYGRPSRSQITIKEGGVTRTDVTLGSEARILLEVNTTTLDPTTRARVDLLRLPGRHPVERRRKLSRVRLDPIWGRLPRTGRLVFTDLAQGTYLVVVEAGGAFETAEVTVQVQKGKDVEVYVDLTPR